MRAVGLHPDVVVVTSRFWQTTCTLVRSGEEAFMLDSPVLPDELELVPAIAAQADFRVVGRMATHADWDHLLGGYSFPDAPLTGTRWTAWRYGSRGRPCSSAATTSPRWRSRGSRRAARPRPTSRRSTGWSRSSRRPRTWCRGTGPRSTASARSRSCA